LEANYGWRNVVASLVAGIGHDLNGHVTALKGIAHVARTGTGLDAEMLDLLDEQVARLEEAVRMLRGLPLVLDDRAELTSLKDVIDGVTRLWARRSGAQQARVRVTAEGEVPVVLMRRRPLAAGLLLLLSAVEPGAGEAQAIDIRYGSDSGGGGWVRIECSRDASAEITGRRSAEIEARQWVERAGARLQPASDSSRLCFEVHIPYASDVTSESNNAAPALH
jgi:hypothetical protein